MSVTERYVRLHARTNGSFETVIVRFSDIESYLLAAPPTVAKMPRDTYQNLERFEVGRRIGDKVSSPIIPTVRVWFEGEPYKSLHVTENPPK